MPPRKFPRRRSRPRSNFRGERKGLAEKLVLQASGTRSPCSSGGPYRWRVAVLALVVPGIVCASVVKLARTSSQKPQPILCDGVNDDTDASILWALPTDATKKLLLAKIGPLPGGMISSPAILRRHAHQVTPQRISSTAAPRFKQLLRQRACPSADSEGAH